MSESNRPTTLSWSGIPDDWPSWQCVDTHERHLTTMRCLGALHSRHIQELTAHFLTGLLGPMNPTFPDTVLAIWQPLQWVLQKHRRWSESPLGAVKHHVHPLRIPARRYTTWNANSQFLWYEHLARFLTPLNSHTATRRKGVMKNWKRSIPHGKQMAISVQIADRGVTPCQPLNQRRKKYKNRTSSLRLCLLPYTTISSTLTAFLKFLKNF